MSHTHECVVVVLLGDASQLTEQRYGSRNFCISVSRVEINKSGQQTPQRRPRRAQTTRHPRYPSGGILFVLNAGSCPGLRLDSSREGSQIMFAFNFIRMNSWRSEERTSELWMRVFLALSGIQQLFGGAGSLGLPRHSRGFVVQYS